MTKMVDNQILADIRNLRNMRRFYLSYQIWNAVSTKLSWTHYRVLIKIELLRERELLEIAE